MATVQNRQKHFNWKRIHGLKRQIFHTVWNKLENINYIHYEYSRFIPQIGWWYYYAVVYYDNSFIYFGDRFINKFDAKTRQWSQIGEMLQGRWEHNVIFDGNYFLVIGGSDKLMTRAWTVKNKKNS